MFEKTKIAFYPIFLFCVLFFLNSSYGQIQLSPTPTQTMTPWDAYPELDYGDVIPSHGKLNSWFEYVVRYVDMVYPVIVTARCAWQEPDLLDGPLPKRAFRHVEIQIYVIAVRGIAHGQGLGLVPGRVLGRSEIQLGRGACSSDLHVNNDMRVLRCRDHKVIGRVCIRRRPAGYDMKVAAY